jgi:sialate O-acetylesterase
MASYARRFIDPDNTRSLGHPDAPEYTASMPFVPLATLLLAQTASAPFVDPLFSDNMVLQRDRSDAIWGWTSPGEHVSVSLDGRNFDAVANATGKWMTKLPSYPAGGSYTLMVTGSTVKTFENVTFGDVWICSGQSNMEFGVGNLANPSQEIQAANYPNIRLYRVPKLISAKPVDYVQSNWEVCTPDNLAHDGDWNGFSAVGYFFGRQLYKDLNVPIGLIHTSWGGTIAEAWASPDSLDKHQPEFHTQVQAIRDEGAADKSPGNNPNQPTVLYNGMVYPLGQFGVKGAIWYQGESNAGRAKQYSTLLPTMIQSWRDQFGQGNFEFLIVQLAGFQHPPAQPGDDAWADLRDSQMIASRTSPNAGIATAIDIGDQNDIHPKNKQEVGRRLALVAEAKTYGKHVEYAGPTYRAVKVEGNTIRVSFDHAVGLKTADGQAPKSFAVEGADQKWHWADAKIDGDTVIVSSSDVSKPIAVSYAWATFQDLNLQNGAGLPAFPFRDNVSTSAR